MAAAGLPVLAAALVAVVVGITNWLGRKPTRRPRRDLWNDHPAGSLAVLVLKLVGYLVPPSFMERPTPSRVATLLTVALLAALVVTQTLEHGTGIVLDARVPALGVAALLLALRAPFIVVVISAALVAALLRLLGWMA